MAHDVFVSYSQHDKATADAIVARLEQDGSRCWIAPRDVVPGSSWGSAIVDAISAARVMVLVLSEHSNRSGQVVREVEQAVARDVIILPFRIDPANPTGAMAYFLGTQHWLDALTPPLAQHIERLSRTVRMLLDQGAVPAGEFDRPPAVVAQAQRPRRRRAVVAASAVVLAGAALVLGVMVIDRGSVTPPPVMPSPSPAPLPSAPPVALEEVGRYQPMDLDLTDLEVPGAIVGFGIEGADLAYANGIDGVTRMSIADPTRPLPMVTFGGMDARDVAISGDELVVAATGTGAIRVMALSADGEVVGDIDIGSGGPTDLMGLEVSDGVGYVASHDYLGIVEVDGAGGLRRASEWIPEGRTGNRVGTFVDARTAYVAAGWEGLAILDVTHPDAPVAIGRWVSPDWVIDAVVVDGIAWLTLGNSGVMGLDVSDPALPRLLGSVALPGFAGPIDVAGGHAFVGWYGSAGALGGVAIVDLRDPAVPTLVDTVGRFSSISEVAVADGHLYVSDESEGLVVFRISGLG